MNRRLFLKTTLAAATATASAARPRYRAAVIGHTGHGNYGHGLDTVWKSFDFIDVVAVADPDDEGRAKGLERTGAKRAYRDYREMLQKEKPDLVSIGPRWLDQRVEMVTAAAEAGAHIYLEKAFARDLMDADRLVEVVERNGVKVQVAHQMVRHAAALRVREMLAAGEIGTIQEFRARGKEDRRAGGEDLMTLGVHLMHLTRMFAGDPRWAFAHVTDSGAEIEPGHVHHERKSSGSMGPMAGNQIAAMFSLSRGVHAYFGSKTSDVQTGQRFGMYFYGSKGVLYLPTIGGSAILRSPDWHSGSWEPIELAAGEQVSSEDLTTLMVADLVKAIEEDRKPAVNEEDGRWTIEMILSVYQSQKTASRVTFPLTDRGHPLETL
jgi:predicted dehydrogenase